MPETTTGLLSPTPSIASEGAAATGILPIARSHPLADGSAKFNALRNFMDSRIYEINGKLSKSFAGYTTFPEVHKDLNAAVDVLWISNTPVLQVPFLVTLSGLFQSAIRLFPWDPTRSLELAAKLDYFFAYMLSNEQVSVGFSITNTDKARINSIAQETRLEMSTATSRPGVISELPSASNTDTESITEDENEDEGSYDQPTLRQAISLGTVYERTLSILGGDLNSLPTESAAVEDPHPSHSDTEMIDL